MESDGEDNAAEHETVIISGDYEEDYESSLQNTTMTVVHAQEIIGGVGHVEPGEIINVSNQSNTKSKYYKQTYRTAWENMPDFKGWLRGVPNEPTRAFCVYCQKTLHAHRLSLLKHTCTMRHQKAAQIHNARKIKSNFEILVQNTTGGGEMEEQQEDDQDMYDQSYLAEEQEDQEDEEDEEESMSMVGLKKDTKKPHGLHSFHSGSPISTHVLDTSRGIPVQGLQVSLYKLIDGRWTYINEGSTNQDGRLWSFIDRKVFSHGRYKLHFDVDRYFETRKQETIYPFIEIVFDVSSTKEQYHIPLLLSPFGYSTYKGS